MVNLDMGRYIEASILSIYNQLDERFEVLVVDGGSKDDSIEILRRLEKSLDRMRVITLPRDANRRLGKDRNNSIKEARGEYVLLHLDCDDLYLPFIQDWVKIYHMIETCYDKEKLISGAQVNMGRRSFLLSHGPYKNLHFEDRELWTRMAASDNWVNLAHRDIRLRMPIPQPSRTIKAISRTYKRVLEDITQPETSIMRYALKQLRDLRISPLRNVLLNFFMTFIVLPAFLLAKGKKKTSVVKPAARDRMPAKSIRRLLKDHGKDFSAKSLSPESLKFFDIDD
jgi:glycosyltransferase involved in cell wall biosynthesis